MPDVFETPAQPPAIVSNDERAGQLIQEAKALDGMMKLSIRATADQMVSRGQALIKAQQLAGKGKWKEQLAKHWKEMNERTARRYMALATEKARADTVSAQEAHTHKVLDDKPDDSESADDETPPLTVHERKILISLIGTVKPGLAKKLRDGAKKLTDAELWKEVPPSCGQCQRLGAKPRPCEACARLRAEHKAGLFDEPEDEDNPESPPKPPPDPYVQAKKSVSGVATKLTQLVNEDPMLYEAMKACRLMDHAGGKLRCCAFAGVAKVIELVGEGETSLKKIKEAYDLASGGFVPPMYERKKR